MQSDGFVRMLYRNIKKKKEGGEEKDQGIVDGGKELYY